MYFDFKTYTGILPFLSGQRRALVHEAPEIFRGLSSASLVLDIGCGNAEIATLVASETGATVIGIDPEPAAVEAARATVVARRSEKLVQLELLDWRTALQNAPAVNKILCLHFVYHLPLDELRDFLELAVSKLRPEGELVFMTTSKGSDAHNLFASADVVRNIVRNSHNLEEIYGRYVFGEDLTAVMAGIQGGTRPRKREFGISWPFGRSSLQFLERRRPNEIEAMWIKLFSFLYRLPPQKVMEEFGPELREMLSRAGSDLSLRGRDVIHVAVQRS